MPTSDVIGLAPDYDDFRRIQIFLERIQQCDMTMWILFNALPCISQSALGGGDVAILTEKMSEPLQRKHRHAIAGRHRLIGEWLGPVHQ